MDKKKGRIINNAGALFGNAMSNNVQRGSDIAIESMKEFAYKADRIADVGFEQAKGNLFEYIEAAKLQTNMANKGKFFDKNPVTDIPESRGGFGSNTAPDDFRMMRDGKIVGTGQAKFNNNAKKTAQNFVNPKYKGMQRVSPVDRMDEIKVHLDDMLKKGEISKSMYQDAVSNLQYSGLTDMESGISSGGTTSNEVWDLYDGQGKVSQDAVRRYVKKFESKQFTKEMGTTSVNMAAMTAVTSGVVSGVRNLFAVYQNRKELDEALKDIGVDVAKGAVRGGVTGLLSSVIRIGANKKRIPGLSDATVATVMAGGIIDGGVAIYSYAKGEITSEQLKDEIVATTAKSVSTVYFTKAINAVSGSVNPFVPIAVYTVASYMVMCTKEIITNAKLNAAEYNRMAELLNESTRLMKEYHLQMVAYMKDYEYKQRKSMQEFLDKFSYNIETGENYDEAVYTIVNFANQIGMELQHTSFSDFEKAMLSDEDFVL